MHIHPVLTSSLCVLHPPTVQCHTLAVWLSIGPVMSLAACLPPSPQDRLQQPRDPECIISSDRKWMVGISNYSTPCPQGVLQQWPFWWFIDLWLNTVLMRGWLAPCNPFVLTSGARASRRRQKLSLRTQLHTQLHGLVRTFTSANQIVNGINTNPYMNYGMWQCQARILCRGSPVFPP